MGEMVPGTASWSRELHLKGDEATAGWERAHVFTGWQMKSLSQPHPYRHLAGTY